MFFDILVIFIFFSYQNFCNMKIWDKFAHWTKADFLAYYKKRSLLSDGDTNTKTAKNERKTKILYLAPAFQNSTGKTVCSHASKGCTDACLFSAGRGGFDSVKIARVRRTEFMLRHRAEFLQLLFKEIERFNTLMKKRGTIGAIRLNGTSDMDFLYLLEKAGTPVQSFAHLRFYDYTKNPVKWQRYNTMNRLFLGGVNYTLCFSRSECNQDDTLRVLENGGTVSVVFRGELPETWHGFPVVDGDKRDDLMLDVKGVVLGLRAKGKAKKDMSGFVI